MLVVTDIHAGYGDAADVLTGVSLRVEEGEVVALVGPNGAGKTTLLHVVTGLVRPRAGDVRFRGRSIVRAAPEAIVAMGISSVAEGRRLFPDQTVRENLLLGAFPRYWRAGRRALLGEVEAMAAQFAPLLARLDQRAATLSGGEQQMLVLARALMARPALVLLDEPSMGLSPLAARRTFAMIGEVARGGTGVLLVEQMARQALAIAHRAYLLARGRIVAVGSGAEMRDDPRLRRAYLGTEEEPFPWSS